MTPRICVSIIPKNNHEALTLIEQLEKANADLIEIRLDCFETSRNLTELAKSTKIPLIATNKLLSEKGNFSGTETERQKTLLRAAKSGFEYVDVDLLSPKKEETIDKLKQIGAKPIVSYHKFDGTLSSSGMKNFLEQEIDSGASICKIVTTAKKIEDNLSVLNFASINCNTKLVVFCMGKYGKLSRLLSPLFGAFFTFASLGQGYETAPGQMTIHEMKSFYDLLGA